MAQWIKETTHIKNWHNSEKKHPNRIKLQNKVNEDVNSMPNPQLLEQLLRHEHSEIYNGTTMKITWLHRTLNQIYLSNFKGSNTFY